MTMPDPTLQEPRVRSCNSFSRNIIQIPHTVQTYPPVTIMCLDQWKRHTKTSILQQTKMYCKQSHPGFPDSHGTFKDVAQIDSWNCRMPVSTTMGHMPNNLTMLHAAHCPLIYQTTLLLSTINESAVQNNRNELFKWRGHHYCTAVTEPKENSENEILGAVKEFIKLLSSKLNCS